MKRKFLLFNLYRVDDNKSLYYVGYIATKVKKMTDKMEMVDTKQITKIDIKKVKFTYTAKDKMTKFYVELQKYLREAFYQFELSQFKAKAPMKTKDFIAFNKEFRKNFKPTDTMTDYPKIIAETAD